MPPANQGEPDPFENLELDEKFVREASIREAAASERIEHLRRIDAEHRRLAEERQRRYREVAEADAPSVRRGRRARGWISIGLVIVLLGVLFWSNSRDGTVRRPSSVDGLTGLTDTTTVTIPIEGGSPPPGDTSPVPLGEPAPLERTSDAYRFIAMQQDGTSPVAYSPCRPIHFVVNDEKLAPDQRATMARLTDDAVARVSAATGLLFQFDGGSSERPSDERAPYQPGRYGDRWAPVLVAWSDPGESPSLEGATAGIGGSAALPLDTGSVYLTGSLLLDAPDLLEMLESPGGEEVVRAVVMHELAHVVGLAHVDDESQLMNDEGHPDVVDFGAGDLSGLSRLGRGDCFPGI